MRYSLAASGLLGLAAAAPQVINIDAALAVPTPTILGPKIEETKPAAITYNPVAAASAVAAVVKNEGAIEKRDVNLELAGVIIPNSNATISKRNACDAQPLGAGPVASPDTPDAFLQNSEISQAATGAGTPTGYKQSFVNKIGSSQQIGYLTYKLYNTYDVDGCAAACNSERYCRGFNIYFERDPSVEPGPACSNPPSTTNIKCSLYGYPVAGNAATNEGQWREQFHVVIAGSNGYSKIDKALPTVNDFKAPTSLQAAINAPLDNGYDTYNGMRLFNNNPYDPALCAAACEAQTDYDKAHPDSSGNYKPCNFFTSYILTKNDVPLGTYCALYTRSWDSSYATNTGYYDGDDTYKVVDAASYEITSPSSGVNFTPYPAGINVLSNPGFESGPDFGYYTPVTDWPGSGDSKDNSVYQWKYQPAAHSGSAYTIFYYLKSRANPVPLISQKLTKLDTTKSYTLTFYYNLLGIEGVSGCTLSATLGDANIYSKVLTSADFSVTYDYTLATSTPVTPSAHEETLKIRYECANAQSYAYSYVFLDDFKLSSN